MKNYREQNGCWNCKFSMFEDHPHQLSSWTEDTFSLTCSKVNHSCELYWHTEVEPYGICDLHEQEE